jgi:aminobenzoyl-glutamate utilization protein B
LLVRPVGDSAQRSLLISCRVISGTILDESFGKRHFELAVETVGLVAQASGDNKGSTDVSDVTWVVPTGCFATACWVPGTPAHSWQATAAGGTSIGRKGMDLAARVLAATAWDLFHEPETLVAAEAELQNRLAGRRYQSLLLPGQEPPLDYRDPPRRSVGP